jgi:superfamily I DNA/RNA helicase
LRTFDTQSQGINEEFEHLIDFSKKSINKKIDPNLQKTLKKLNKKIQSEIKNSKENNDADSLIYLKLLKKVTKKFKKANNLLLALKQTDCKFDEIDTLTELDILLSNLKKIVNKSPKKINVRKLEADIEKIEEIEDQKKRVLMTYLMTDWKNLEYVLSLMKLGETYRDIADDLLSITLFKN